MDRTTNGDDGVEKQAEFNHLDQAPSKVSSEIDHDHGFTQEEQRSIIRRIDRRLVVTVGAMYCVSLMDRTNMSAANIAGMSVELQLTGFRYNIANLVFFIPYVIFQPPSTILIRKVGPRLHLALITMMWGAVMVGMGFVKKFPQLAALRAVLGFFEAGFFPSCVYLLSTWYTRYEVGKRYSVFYLLGCVASAFSGILAYGLMQLNGRENLTGWRWIFIIEGTLTIALGIAGYWLLVDFPDSKRKTWSFLGSRERQWVVDRISRDRGDTEVPPFQFSKFIRGGADWKVWAYAMIFFDTTTISYALAYTLPIILVGNMGFSVGAAQCLVAPPYAFAGIVMFATAWVGDKYHIRGPMILFNMLLCLIGLPIMGWAESANVRTLSLGGPDGWTEAVSGVVASRIAEQGRIVTIAAGNDGQYGSWYASGPGTGVNVISVGSVDNTVVSLQNATVSNGRQIPYQALESLAIPAGLELYATTTDVAAVADACDPLPTTTPDLSNRLVIIRRGTCTFLTKIGNAAKFGAKYFLIYDNKEQSLGAISTGEYPGALISQQDGIFLVQQGIPQKLTVSFPHSPYTAANPSGGLMSSFSTYGPSHDMYLKPAVSAPGGAILSTYPIKLGSYEIASGTSMATPFVAGSSALLFQILGKNAATAKAARSIFENTAIPVKQTVASTSLIETAGHQGAGLINVYDAVKNKGSLLPAELLLNDTANFKGVHTLLVKNGGKKSVTYTLTHVPAGTANTINGIEAILGPVPLISNAASVTIVPNKVTVPAGWSLPVLVSIKPPAGLTASNFPVYSGYIKAVGSDNSTLQSTYLGVAAKLKDARILDNTDAYFGVQLPLVTDKAGEPVPPTGSATYTMTGSDTPLVLYRTVQGSPLLRMDLIDSKTNVTTNTRRSIEIEERSEPVSGPYSTLSKRSIWDWLFPNRGSTSGGSFAAVKTLGVLYQEDYIPRNSAAATADANGYSGQQITAFANGTAIPDGSYKILVRALKITGNPKKQEDYEVWTSPTVVIKRA